MIDATRVGSKLYIGSRPGPELLKHGFDVVVLCAKERQDVWPDIHTIRVPFNDSELSYRTYTRAVKAAMAVTRYRLAGQRVLVTCNMGVNRSALVAALSLMQLERLSARDVLERIRRLRGPHVQFVPLSNPDFEEALYHFERLARGGRNR